MSQAQPPFAGFFTFTLLLVIATVFLSAYQVQHQPLAVEQLDTIDPQQFSPDRAYQQLQQLYVDAGSHPIGTAANEQLKNQLVRRLQALGYQIELQNRYSCSPSMRCGYVSNVIAYQQRPSNNNAILLNAHYDSTSGGLGVSDNGVNVAIGLEVARMMQAKYPENNPLLLLLSDGEENGLLGARAFVEHALAAQVGAVVNLEARGTSGRSLMFETSPGNAPLLDVFGASFTQAKTNSIFYEVYQRMPNDTDFSVFKRAGMKGYNFAFIGELKNYHTVEDSVDNADINSMAEQGRAAANLIVQLAELKDLSGLGERAANRVYTDIGGWLLLDWSPMLSIILALVSLAIALFVLVNHHPNKKPIARGLLMMLLSLVVTAGVCQGLTVLITNMTMVSPPWLYAQSTLMVLFWSVTLLVGAGVYQLTTGSLSVEHHCGVLVLVFAVLALLLAVVIPGASYLYLLAVVPGALLLLWSKTQGQNKAAWWQSVTLVSMVGLYALVATDIAYLLQLSMGLRSVGGAMPILLLPVAMGLVALAKGSTIEGKLLSASFWGLALLMGGSLWQLSQPLPTDIKQRANLVHYQQGEQSYWLLMRSPARIEPQFKQALNLKPQNESMASYSRFGSALATPGEKLELADMTRVERRDMGEGKVRLTVTLIASPDHHYLAVKLPPALKYHDLMLDQQSVTPEQPWRLDRRGYRQVTVFGHFERDVKFTIEYEADAGEQLALEVDQVRAITAGFGGPATTKIWTEYERYYQGVHRGNLSIVSTQIQL